MTCEECDILLAQRLVGDLDSADELELDAHLATCFECSQRAEEYESLGHGISLLSDAYADAEPPASWQPTPTRVRSRARYSRLLSAARVSLAAAATIAFAFAVKYSVDVTPDINAKVVQSVPKELPSSVSRTYRTARFVVGIDRRAESLTGRLDRVPTFLPFTRLKPEPLRITRVKTPSLLLHRRRTTHVEELHESQDDRTRSRSDTTDLSGLG